MIRVGILGAGGISERAMVEPSSRVDGIEVRAIGARDPERANAFAKRLNIPKSGNYESVLSDPQIDLIYLALPPIVHADLAERALRAGKHVLCEKPLSANEAGARRVADAAKREGRRAFVGFHYRLHGFTQNLLRVIESGVLGEIEKIKFDFSIPHFVVKPGNIRLDGNLAGGSFMDVGCYAVDLIRAAWGEPTVLSAEAHLYPDDPRIDLQTDAVLALGQISKINIRTSFIGDDKGSMSLDIIGSKASLNATSVIVPQWGATLKVTSQSGQTIIQDQALEGENSYVRQLEHLVAVLASGELSMLEAEGAVGTMRLVDDVYRSAGLQTR